MRLHKVRNKSGRRNGTIFFLLAAIFFERSFPAGLSGIPHAGIRGFGPYRPVGTFGPGRVAAVPPEHPASGRNAAVGEALRSRLGTSEDMDYLCAPSERADARPREGFPKRRARSVSSVRGEIPGFRRMTAGATAFPNRKPNRIRYDELFV